jgi:hypothetical protein
VAWKDREDGFEVDGIGVVDNSSLYDDVLGVSESDIVPVHSRGVVANVAPTSDRMRGTPGAFDNGETDHARDGFAVLVRSTRAAMSYEIAIDGHNM